MKKEFTTKEATVNKVVKCYEALKECISFDNIENTDFIHKKLNLIERICKGLPNEITIPMKKYIHKEIHPIIYDVDYFDFLRREEFGEVDEEGHFVINSESSLEMMIFLMYEHTLELNERLNDFMLKHLKANFSC